jgi:hypothetical protein
MNITGDSCKPVEMHFQEDTTQMPVLTARKWNGSQAARRYELLLLLLLWVAGTVLL